VVVDVVLVLVDAELLAQVDEHRVGLRHDGIPVKHVGQVDQRVPLGQLRLVAAKVLLARVLAVAAVDEVLAGVVEPRAGGATQVNAEPPPASLSNTERVAWEASRFGAARAGGWVVV